tara:strand:+ start:440 stop:676 length:237 start_codon:yes stop_codon:yes gene_type:complete
MAVAEVAERNLVHQVVLVVQVGAGLVVMEIPAQYMERQEPQTRAVAEVAGVTSTEMAEQVAPVLLSSRTPILFPAQVL